MLGPIMIQGSFYQVKVYKRLLLSVLLAAAGTLGTMILFFVENGEFGGTSFFGAVFFVPVLFVPITYLLKISYDSLMDLCAPAECAMLVVMKLQCFLTGCCGGVSLSLLGSEFVFPSQLAELFTALFLCVSLLVLSRDKKCRGKIYPLYMVFYGVTRFILNVFRKTNIVEYLHMPFGNFWSLLAIFFGVLWLILIKNMRLKYGSAE